MGSTAVIPCGLQVWGHLEHAGLEANPACINAYVQALVYQVRSLGQDSSLQLHTESHISLLLDLASVPWGVPQTWQASVQPNVMLIVKPSGELTVKPRP